MSWTVVMAKTCLVCDRLVQDMIGNMETVEECYHIYNQNHLLREEVTLLTRLAEVLGIDIRGSIWHSDVLCKQCFALIREMDALEQRLLNFCACMRSQFVNTAGKYNIYASVTDTIPSLYLRNVLDKPLTETKAVGTDSPYLCTACASKSKDDKENEPVKIECVPDSDLFNLSANKSQEKPNQTMEPEPPSPIDLGKPVPQSDDSKASGSPKKKKVKKAKKKKKEEDNQLFNCIICSLGQMNATELNTHMSEHEQKDKPYKCPVCCITFGYQETLDIHMKKHKVEDSYSTDWAPPALNGAVSPSDSGSKTVNLYSTKFLCSVCGWVGDDLGDCATHLSLHEALICGSCCHAVEDQNSLKAHSELCTALNSEVESDHDPDSLTCKLCNEKCTDQQQLKTHMETHRKYNCSQCDAKFYRKYHLERHEATQHGIDKTSKPVKSPPVTARGPKVECPICGVTLSRKDHLKRHVMNIHNNSNGNNKKVNRKTSGEVHDKKCNVCGLELSSTSNLKQHMVIHSDQHPFSCSLCGRRFKLQKYLDLHMMLHRGDKKHVCADCGKSYAHKTGYNRHRRSHTGERPHICEFCGQTFAHLGGLKSHILIHTGERPHRCDECGYGARTFMKLQIHKRKHTGEKPYHCEYCGKNFAYKYNFDAHLRIHRGEKRFVCQICQRAFDRRSKYSEHMDSHSTTSTTTTTVPTIASTPFLVTQSVPQSSYLPQMVSCSTDLHFLST